MAVGRTRWVLVFWMFVVAAVSYLDRNNISIAATAIQNAFKLSNPQLGGVFSALIADRFGWTASFVFAAALLVVGAIAWLFVDPDKQLVTEDAPEAAAA